MEKNWRRSCGTEVAQLLPKPIFLYTSVLGETHIFQLFKLKYIYTRHVEKVTFFQFF